MFTQLQRFIKNISGQIAPIMAVATFPLLATVGLSVDYALISAERSELQSLADAAALARRDGVWLDRTIYQVEKTAEIKTYFMGILGQQTKTIHVLAQSYVEEPVHRYKPPEFYSLDGSASFNNYLGVYCYDEQTEKRSELKMIADNRGKTYFDGTFSCKPGEVLQYFLYTNNFTTNPRHLLSLTDSGKKNTGVNYDNLPATTFKERNGYVESVVCDTLAECVKPNCTSSNKLNCLIYESQGGKIPKGNYRESKNEMNQCAPGKYLYLGWDDGADGYWSDKDYNDAVIIFSCPDIETVGGKTVFLYR